jgi:hypothetical protein
MQFPKRRVFYSFGLPDNEQGPNPRGILRVIHHRQKHFDSAYVSGIKGKNEDENI